MQPSGTGARIGTVRELVSRNLARLQAQSFIEMNVAKSRYSTGRGSKPTWRLWPEKPRRKTIFSPVT